MPDQSPDITEILHEWSGGNREALDELLPVIMSELRTQAARYLRKERSDHTLQTTALINEAYIRLVDQRKVKWQNRAHFFGIASQMMRRILVDHARTKTAGKRGGVERPLSLDDVTSPPTRAANAIDLIALDRALTKLSEMDEQKGRIVEFRYFSGLSVEETAEVMGVSAKTVERNWTIARAWLRRELK